MRVLQQAGIPAGAVRTMAELLDDAHLHARGFWQQAERPCSGRYQASTAWFRSGAGPMPIRRVAPTLGQHNEEVLAGMLGLDPSRIAELERIGIIGNTALPKPPGTRS
jgi:crotonobetainyl-CoA:carnitine CoA-transferase CaiB-like acyl-CoA transferase